MKFFSNFYTRPFSLKTQIRSVLYYPSPTNLSYWWNFGSLSAVFLFVQIITGILLSFWYVPHIDFAFNSVAFIMREVNYGWLVRYSHSNGASFFFLCVYIHMARSLFFGSYAYPRQKVWYSGMIIFVLMMITAFLGYILPWGQMSFWGATVITSLVSVVPFVGDQLLVFLWGGMGIDQPTLTRVYGLHFILPFLILGFVIVHIALLHMYGSNNPLGIKVSDHTPFYPYFFYKDFLGIIFVLLIFIVFVCFFPNYLGHPHNWIMADPSVTPPHIVPEWYFLPFYGILRSVPNKFGGVFLMGLALVLLYLLPLIHEPLVRSSYFRPLFRIFLYIFFASFYLLGWTGTKPVAFPYYQICQISTIYFFCFFLIILPLIAIFELRCWGSLPLDESVFRNNNNNNNNNVYTTPKPLNPKLYYTLNSSNTDYSNDSRISRAKLDKLDKNKKNNYLGKGLFFCYSGDYFSFLDFSKNFQISFQDSATCVMSDIVALHNYLLFYLCLILIFVGCIFCSSFLSSSKKVNILFVFNGGSVLNSNQFKSFFKLLTISVYLDNFNYSYLD